MVDMKSLLTMQGMMFTMLLVGVFIRRKGIVTSEGRKSLTNLLVNLILPCNILYAFSKSDTSALGSMAVVILMSALSQLTWYILSKFLWKGMDDSRRGIMRYAFQFPTAVTWAIQSSRACTARRDWYTLPCSYFRCGYSCGA